MQVSTENFINSPAIYLEKARDSIVTIIKDGNPIAVLSRPIDTPIANNLLGLLKDSGINSKDDIRAMRTGA